ncbi:MAG: epoxyqueuosine reductase QueH [Lachnospiraceae bacterium]|nr:epoxyqueuosine reductase QueH [Lachnospiraceae bacterium]
MDQINRNLPGDHYIRRMNESLSAIEEPKVLLHVCCAPCSSFCLLTLREVANIGVYYYNPNITLKDEYDFRYSEVKRLVKIYNEDRDLRLEKECRQISFTNSYVNREITIVEAPFESEKYLEAVKGYEDCPERGDRCGICFEMRLRKTAIEAKNKGYDFFATSLTLSPLKDAHIINHIGEKIGKEVDIKYLPTDFKKKNGYKKSIELSAKYDLYRQNYCGCVFSKRQDIDP